MDPVTVAVVTFLFVGGSVFLAATLLLRVLPAVQRERLRTPVAEAAPSSILRWRPGGAGWQGIVERLGRAGRATGRGPSLQVSPAAGLGRVP